jgi:RHS repeat-associated protein
LVNTYAYDAYGNTTASTGSVANPLRYTGEYQDAESGLYYLRARYYDPASQQFLTRDPLVAATEQAYNYAGGSPLNATDPSGLRFSINDEGGGGGAVDLGGAPGEGGGGAGSGAGAEAAAEEAVGEMGGWSEAQRDAAIADEGELAQVEGQQCPSLGYTVEDILRTPDTLWSDKSGGVIKSPEEVEQEIGNTPGWQAETLGKGTHEGQGWVFREYLPNGKASGRMIRWHPGGGHHGPEPYWTVTSPQGGVVRIGPQFR